MLQSITFIQFFKCLVSFCRMTTNARWRGTRSRGLSSRGECEMERHEEKGATQMDIEGNQQMDMDNDDGEHETENDGAEA
jgi:hypothetical protein